MEAIAAFTSMAIPSIRDGFNLNSMSGKPIDSSYSE
jgi:hypothetical protein